jgi:integrase/recombinase XerD
MLSLYRRHVKACRFFSGKSTNGNRRSNNCRCPVHVDGYLAGKRVNRSLKVRDWTRANEIIRDWEIAGSTQEAPRTETTITEACEEFMADVEAQRLSDASVKKYKVLLVNRRRPENREKHSPSLTEFCAENSIRFTSQVTLPVLTRFRGEWKDGAIAGGKKLERLRAYGGFLLDRGWWKENLAQKLKRPKVTDPPTMPYTQEEVTALLAACNQFTDWHGQADQENARRLRALILLLRYSGLRIGDAASCPVDRLTGNRLFLTMQKPGCRSTFRCRPSWLMHSTRAPEKASAIGFGPASDRRPR